MCVIPSLQINLARKDYLALYHEPLVLPSQDDIGSTEHDRTDFFIDHRSVSRHLVKSEEFLRDLISRDGEGSSAFSRKVHALSQEAPAESQVERRIGFL